MKVHIGIIAFLLVILIGAGSYILYQNPQLLKGKSSPSPSPTISSGPTPLESPAFDPSPFINSEITQNAIKTNINATNYEGLKDYMTSQVHIILQATECCGNQTPIEAIDQLSYIDGGIPFDFDQSNPTIVALKDQNPELQNKYIGISDTEHLIAFGVNNNNLIEEIRMSVSWKLFNF